MEWDDDDRGFEVEDAVCNDGRKYELKFDANYLFTAYPLITPQKKAGTRGAPSAGTTLRRAGAS
jgi:hypothetical protein